MSKDLKGGKYAGYDGMNFSSAVTEQREARRRLKKKKQQFVELRGF